VRSEKGQKSTQFVAQSSKSGNKFGHYQEGEGGGEPRKKRGLAGREEEENKKSTDDEGRLGGPRRGGPYLKKKWKKRPNAQERLLKENKRGKTLSVEGSARLKQEGRGKGGVRHGGEEGQITRRDCGNEWRVEECALPDLC